MNTSNTFKILIILLLLFQASYVFSQGEPPADGLMLLTPQEGQRFYRRGITITAVAERNVTIQLSINGQFIKREKTVNPARFPKVAIDPNAAIAYGLTAPSVIGVWSFIDVKLQPGPNRITVKVMGGTYDGAEVTRNVYIVGPPKNITISAEPKNVRADGISTSNITVTLTDESGENVQDGIYFVTIDPGTGKLMPSRSRIDPAWSTEEAQPKSRIVPAQSPSLDAQPGVPGIQLPVKNGKATAILGPSLQIGETELIASYNDIRAKIKVRYIPLLPSSWLIAALATGKLTNFEIKDDAHKFENLGNRLVEDSDLFYDKRTAIFLKGPISDRFLLTGAYDSERKPYGSVERERIFRQLEPDKLYSIYGDSSSLFYEAQSSAKGYLKLEKARSYGLFGDYNTTDLSDSEFAAYKRSLTGAKVHINERNVKLVGIGAWTEQGIVRQELPGEGTSGFYYLEKAPVVQLSEKVQIEIRDRFHSENIIRIEPKHRYIDYDIDYEQGTVLFKQPVPSRDGNYNPVYIVVIYESVEPVKKDYVTALHGEIKGEDENSRLAAMVGGTLIKEGFDKDADSFGMFQLTAFHGKLGTIDNKNTLYGEFARSEYQDKKGKDCEGWKIEFNSRPIDALSLEAYYRDIGKDFHNPSTLLTEAGTKKYGASLDLTVGKGGEFHTEHYRSKQNILTTGLYLDTISTSGWYQHKLGRITARLGAEHLLLKEDKAKRETESLLGVAGFDLELIPDKLAAQIQRDQNFMKDDQLVNYKPDATNVGLSYKISNKITTYANHKIPDDKPFDFDNNSTVVGVRSTLMGNLTAFSEYRIGGAIAGETNQASIGLRNRLRLTPDIAVNIAAERRRFIDDLDAAGDFDALSLSAEYLPVDIPAKTTGKYEIRKTPDSINDLAEVGIDFKIKSGFSFIGKNRFYREIWRKRPDEPQFIKNHTIAGIALRPENTNIINALAKVDVKYNDNAPTGSNMEPFLANKSLVVIGSTDLILQPIRHIELYGKYAIKWRREEDFDPENFDPDTMEPLQTTSTTNLYISRLRLELNNYIDIAGEYRLLYQHAIKEFEHGASTELGLWFIPNLRIAIGYNFLGTSDKDKDFPESKYWARGPFVRLSLKY